MRPTDSVPSCSPARCDCPSCLLHGEKVIFIWTPETGEVPVRINARELVEVIKRAKRVNSKGLN